MSEQMKMIVGCEEWCQFGQLALPAVKARVDSGARTSALHAFNIQPFVRKGDQWVSFEVHPIQDNRRIVVRCESRVVDRRTIKSSSGETEKRYVIRTALTVLTGEIWDIEVTLTNRDSMGYRMLLGREAMAKRIMVDPGAHFVLGDQTEDEVFAKYRDDHRKMSGLKIGVIASNPKLFSNQRIMEAGEERGHEMIFLNVKHCYMKLDAQTPEVHYRGGWVLDDLDAVIPRIRPSMTFYGCALIRHFESLQVFTLNTANAITSSRDKLFSLQLLLQQGIAVPITGFANSPLDTKDLIEMVGGAPLIVKLLEGAQGSGVVLAETDKAAESVINAFKTIHANILVQEFIKEALGSDIRCFVVNGKVVGAIQRTAAAGDFRANIHLGGTASVVKITADERKIAIKAAKVLGLSVAGVDIIRSKRGPLLLEVNSSPGLQGVETATGKDIAGHMIAAVEKNVNWSRELGSDSLNDALTDSLS